MIIDLLFAAILIVFLIIGFCRGASKTILSVLSVVGAAVLSFLLSHFLAELIADSFIRTSIVDNVSNALRDSFAGDCALAAAAVLASLPGYALTAMNYFGVSNSNVESYCADAIASGTENVAEVIADAVMPTVTGAVATVLGILLFIVLIFVFHRLANLLSRFFRLPLIRTLDKLLGAIGGTVEGIVTILILVVLINLIIPIISAEWVTDFESYVNSSHTVSLINSGEISSWIQLFIYNVEKLVNI